MTRITCVCGYSVDDGEELVEENIYYQSGKRKGELKGIKQVYRKIDPDKKLFVKIEIEKGFSFVKKAEKAWHDDEQVDVVACPECGTLKMLKWW